jgi:hypothetical protein
LGAKVDHVVSRRRRPARSALSSNRLRCESPRAFGYTPRMPPPQYQLQLTSEHFNDQFVGTGLQLRQLLGHLGASVQDCVWYGADIEATGMRHEALKGWVPQRIGSIDELWAASMAVDQFIWGVFLALPVAVGLPDWPAEVGAQDPAFRDIGSARLEVRAFDTSWWDVYSSDSVLMQRLAGEFGVAVKENPSLSRG